MVINGAKVIRLKLDYQINLYLKKEKRETNANVFMYIFCAYFGITNVAL